MYPKSCPASCAAAHDARWAQNPALPRESRDALRRVGDVGHRRGGPAAHVISQSAANASTRMRMGRRRLQGETTETALGRERGAPPPAVAFLLAGAAGEIGTSPHAMANSFLSNVVHPLHAGNSSAVFIAVKAIHHSGVPYNASQEALLDKALTECIHPARGYVSRVDTAALLYAATANRLRVCAYNTAPRAVLGKGRIMRNWWGALATGWDLIAAHEVAQGTQFDDVLVARADLIYSHPMGHYRHYDTERYWFVAPTPMDSFWLLSRRVAAEALPSLRTIWDREASRGATVSHGLESAANVSCPAGMRKAAWGESVYEVCYWVETHWESGLRIATIPKLQAGVKSSFYETRIDIVPNVTRGVVTQLKPSRSSTSCSVYTRLLGKGVQFSGAVSPRRPPDQRTMAEKLGHERANLEGPASRALVS